MISLKLAFRSVFRRPKQNIAVLMGITLGVSLFAGVQIGGDSLSRGFVALSEHRLGDKDAQITNILEPFFVSFDILDEEINGTPSRSIFQQLQGSGPHLDYIDSMAERLDLKATVIEEQSGSIEISKTIVGINPGEIGFGQFYNKEGVILPISSLDQGEVYIGEKTASLIFLDENPVGRNLTVSGSIFSLALPLPGLDASYPVPFEFQIKVVDVFVDKSRGREEFADFIATDLTWLQDQINSAFNKSKEATQKDGTNKTIVGYGSQPISKIIVRWKDSVKNNGNTYLATEVLTEVFEQIVGKDIILTYRIDNTRQALIDITGRISNSIKTILNVFGSIMIIAGFLVIVNIQSMALASRNKETGILRAIGSNRKQVIFANLTESLFLGIFGSLFGLLGGAIYGKLLILFMALSFQLPIADISIVITRPTLISSFVAGFIISQLTGIIPAINASRINIAQVLRGIQAPFIDKFGRKSLYLGVIISIFSIFSVLRLDPNPLFDGKDAFATLESTQAIYIPVVSLILGPSLLFAYYKSKKIGLTVFAIFILFWANYNVFVIFKWIKSGDGGLNYILSLILSMIVGSILLFGLNLNLVASFGEKFTSLFIRSKNSSLRSTSLVAFRKMTSKATRSTLTFALFATILTLNIFIGTWSYSFRYGFDQVVVELSGGTDVLLFSDQPIPDEIDFGNQIIREFNTKDENLKFMNSITMSEQRIKAYTNLNDSEGVLQPFLVKLTKESLLDENGDFEIKLNLQDNKTGTTLPDGSTFETQEDSSEDPAFTNEDAVVWQSFLNNGTLLDGTGKELPMILTTPIFIERDFRHEVLAEPGSTVYLNLTDGSIQEFVVGSFVSSNPLVEFKRFNERRGPSPGGMWFVNDYWADRVAGLAPLKGFSNIFLGKSNIEDITSDTINELITSIEIWANQLDGTFRKKNGLFGVIGYSVYGIYEQQLEGQYRFFLFLQAFVSLGFIVGILGLLVVASRSVAERTREIGMLRALGFRRRDVVLSVILELVVMGLIGLVIGFINGTILGYALTDINSGGDARFLIPWNLLGIYALITLSSALIAAIFPALKASKIPPSDALRYNG